MTRTSALRGLRRRLMTRRAGMVASFSTGTSVGEKGDRLQGCERASEQPGKTTEQEDLAARRAGMGLLLVDHHVWAQLRGPISEGGVSHMWKSINK